MKNKFTKKLLLSIVLLFFAHTISWAQVINAGIDQTLCAETTILAATDPTAGWYGVWSVNAGFGVFVDASNRNTAVNSMALGNNIFRWSVYTDTHSFVNYDDVIITNNLKVANAGADMPICIDNTTLNGNNPSPGTGVWNVVAGGGTFTNNMMYNTNVTNIPLGLSTYHWQISHIGCNSSDDVNVTNNAIIANAGADIPICMTSTTLSGNNPSPGVGIWATQSGSGIFTNNALYNTPVTGVGLGANTYRWTITNAGCTANDDVVVTNNSFTVSAGTDADICGSAYNLAGTEPGTGMGNWSVVSGTGSFASPNLYNTTVSAIDPGTTIFRWTVSNAGCMANDDVAISNRNIPANAGMDFQICNSTAVINGNNPSPGTGHWTDVSSSGVTFANSSMANTAVSNIPTGVTVLRWNILNFGCPTFDEVNITNNTVTMIHAGTDQDLCVNYGMLTANSLSIGELGKWTILKGKATFSDNTANSTNFNNLGLGINEFRWTIKKGNCLASDDIIVKNLSPYVNAGDDKAVYETNASVLSGNMPVGGAIGVWSVVAGTGVFGNANEPTTPVTSLEDGENIFKWTITPTSGLCSGLNYTDEASITVGIIKKILVNTNWITPPSVTIYDKVEVYAPFNVDVPVIISEIYLGNGAKMTIGGSGKAAGSLTVKGLTIEPDPSKSNKAAVATLTIGSGGSLTIEPDPAKKGFVSSINSGGTLTIEPDPARKGAQLTLTSGSGLAVNAGGTLTIEPDPAKNIKSAGVVTVDEGAHLLIEEGGRLINLSTSSIIGNVDYNFIFPYNAWNFFSSPVQTANVNFFRGAYMYKYEENTNDWINLVLNDPLEPLYGTILKYLPEKVAKEVFFSGTPNSNTVTRNLSLTGDPINFGYNLVGNPYSTSIFWNQPAGFNKTNTTGAIYVWNGAQYLVNNGTVGVPGETSPVIDISQAFFVQATNDNGLFQVFPEAQMEPTKKQLPKQPTDIIRFKLTNDELKDEMAVYFDQNASINYDLGFDANKFMKSQDDAANGIFYPQIYSITPQNNLLSIDVLNMENSDNVSIPIGININTNADLKLTAFGFEQFDANVSLILEDKDNNLFQDLRQNPLLSIKVAQGKTDNRFILHFSKNTTRVDDITSNTVSAFSYQKTIYINLGSEKNATVEVFDILGKKLITQKLENLRQTSIQTELPSGNYILKISNNSIQHNQKILIK